MVQTDHVKLVHDSVHQKNISPHQNLFFGVKIVTVWWNIAGCMSWYTRDIDNVMFWFLKIPTLNLRGWKSDQTFTLQIYIRFLKHETRKTHRIIKDHIKQNVCLAFESLKKKRFAAAPRGRSKQVVEKNESFIFTPKNCRRSNHQPETSPVSLRPFAFLKGHLPPLRCRVWGGGFDEWPKYVHMYVDIWTYAYIWQIYVYIHGHMRVYRYIFICAQTDYCRWYIEFLNDLLGKETLKERSNSTT